jgi:group I intron endonuclease
MVKRHYVYHSYEEWGRDYIGIRSCNCLPEEDTKYFGSFTDKTFNPTGKTILFVRKTRQEVAEIEIILHDFFDVAVNPQFANQAKQTSTRFDRTGVSNTEETKKKISEALSGEKHPLFGVPRTEEWKKAMSGEKHPQFGIPLTEETKKKISEALSGEKHPLFGVPGKTGALHPSSKAIIAIEPDGTKRHFGSGREAAKELEIPRSSLRGYLKPGKQPTRGKFKGWQFLFENRQVFGVKLLDEKK